MAVEAKLLYGRGCVRAVTSAESGDWHAEPDTLREYLEFSTTTRTSPAKTSREQTLLNTTSTWHRLTPHPPL